MILAVIPARGGSVGLPRKNLRRIAGIPMIAYTIRAAREASLVDRVLVSTDDRQIARVARQHGADVPFLRPEHLARSETATVAVVDHAVRAVESSGHSVSVVVTLQPTSPFRGGSEIDAALQLLEATGARSVVTVASVGWPVSVLGALVDGRMQAYPMSDVDRRRQTSPPAVRVTGAIYVTRRGLLGEGRLLDDRPAALLTTGPAALDIDDIRDLRAARRAAGKR